MKLGVHITFFYVESRLQYLEKVIEGIASINEDTTVFIYSNRNFKLKEHTENINIVVYDFANKKSTRLKSIHRLYYQTLLRLGYTKLVHPFYLTWVNRKYVTKHIEDFDVQMYLEDDIYFDIRSFKYWLTYKDACIGNGYNLGFLRYEKDKNEELYFSDLFGPMDKIVTLEGKKFLLNDVNPYCGFWIYEKSELKKFMQSKQWKFKFNNYRVRERSAVGWHGFQMEHYKCSLLPLNNIKDNIYQCSEDAFVHHLPNNYIGHDFFCKVKAPIEMEIG